MLDKRHGGAYDRGTADSWYSRGFHPHKFEGASYSTPRVTALTVAEVEEYRAGFAYNEADPSARKEWE
jgi:hypothetical protein